jgi:hypothetical protein
MGIWISLASNVTFAVMNPSIEDRLIATEKRIDELKKKPKGFWDIFQIVATLLIPASITLAGYWYSDAQKQAEIRSSENIAAQLRDTSLMQVRVGQAQLISTFMESLLSEKPQRQKLAIEGVLVALPEEGPRLVQIVSEDKSSPAVQQAAIASLDQRRSRLITDCFSGDKLTRISATTELIQGWLRDKKLVTQLVETAQKNSTNASGVINTLVVLENVDGSLLAAHADLVTQFAESVRSAGPQTAGHVAQVEARLKDAIPAR